MRSFGDRFGWSLEMYAEHAEPLYRHRYPDATLIPLDDAGAEQGDDGAAKQLDYSGLDLVVKRPDGRTLQFGQRFRTDVRGFERDFSLRAANFYGDRDRLCEREKLLADWRDGTLGLDRYAFGIAAGYDRRSALEHGFREWYILHVPRLCEALHDGVLDDETHAKGDGSTATYLPIDDLRDAGAVVTECDWSVDRPSTTGQTGLGDYGRSAHWHASVRPSPATIDADGDRPAVATASANTDDADAGAGGDR